MVMDGLDELNAFSHYEYQIYKKINGESISLENQVPLGSPIINNLLGEPGDP